VLAAKRAVRPVTSAGQGNRAHSDRGEALHDSDGGGALAKWAETKTAAARGAQPLKELGRDQVSGKPIVSRKADSAVCDRRHGETTTTCAPATRSSRYPRRAAALSRSPRNAGPQRLQRRRATGRSRTETSTFPGDSSIIERWQEWGSLRAFGWVGGGFPGRPGVRGRFG